MASVEKGVSLAPFNPTTDTGQQVALKLFHLTCYDSLFDLGCGDGRLLLKAAKSVDGLLCTGIEYNDDFANRAKQNIENESDDLKSRIRIISQDVARCEHLITLEATAVFLYLLPEGLIIIKPILEKVRKKPNSRIVSYLFSIPEWEPDEIGRSKANLPVFLYRSKHVVNPDPI
mmetsp:Transcript_27649/g.39543  ORF Transcript_27649/g.39543 Transcript_27649/m.39543 type:complete len:174 (+) Transcript_27649:64-585(+)